LLSIAQKQDNDEIRKNFYSLIKFMKTHHRYFSWYLSEYSIINVEKKKELMRVDRKIKRKLLLSSKKK
jgi:hypothetical protein